MDRGQDQALKAVVFSVGEITTDLCAEQLEHAGFEVEVWQDDTPLWSKLKRLYDLDEELVRVDADIIPNANVGQITEDDGCLWHCATGWDWYAQDIRPISIHFIRRQALEIGRRHIDEAKHESRPETYIWRLPEFHDPRACHVVEVPMGLHGYRQEASRTRVQGQKDDRAQSYDWSLVERLEAL